jgi:putative ABC transport system permease protein
MISADFGFNTKDIINVQLNNTSYQQLKTELQNHPEVINVTAASHIPAAGTSKSTALKKNWSDDIELDMALFQVDENYIESLGLELIAGGNFQKLDVNAHEIIINAKSLETFSLGTAHEALGQYLIDSEDSANLKIVGVVKNYNHMMLIVDMSPMMLIYNPEKTIMAQVTFPPGRTKEGKYIVEQAFTTVNPGMVADIENFDTQLAFYYNLLFGDIVTVVGIATVLALIIACLGLLGIATYTIETRTKEVGIRKVLGATGKQLVVQLSKGFMSILLISIVIALPLAYFLNNLWLQEFAFRVPISIGVMSFGVIILLVLGMITIGSQTYRATKINPVDSLRNE